MLLIYPPAARSPEPPIGIARLAAFLKGRGMEARCLDLCQEGIEFLLRRDAPSDDTWTRGALRRRGRSAAALRDPDSYRRPDLYARAVGDLNRAMKAASSGSGSMAEASLADYRETARSPLRRTDLLASAEDCESNLFYELYALRIGPELERSLDGLVGISVCYLSQALCAFAIAGYIKKRAPRMRIVLGGGLVTSWVAGGALEASEDFGGLVDALLPGPGERGLGGYLGLGTESSDSPPDFDEFAGLSYFSPGKILPYNFSYGCPWKRCTFCPETAEGLPYRGIPAPAAMAGLRRLAERYRPELFHFADSEISPLYLGALAANPPGSPWYGFARFSNRLLDPGFCDKLAASGCVMLQLGLESGDQAVLDAMGKGTRVEDISVALANLAASSIGVYLYVLFGTPSEDRSAALRTRDFIAERAGQIGFLNVAVFNLPASAAEARELETRPFYDGELSLYRDFIHPKGWGRPELRDFIARDFDSLPEIRKIQNRTPPVFTSSHAPFFTLAKAHPPVPR